METYAEGMPWDANRQVDGGKTCGISEETDSKIHADDEETETKLKEVLSEICPLLDRMGRAFTDLSPHVHRYCQPQPPTPDTLPPNSPPNRPAPPLHGLLPFGLLPHRQMFVPVPSVRSFILFHSSNRRPPSPPPESFFRVPVTAPPRSSNPSGPGSGGHVDIHIHAILTPVRSCYSLPSFLSELN
jgi:hypothetical protein